MREPTWKEFGPTLGLLLSRPMMSHVTVLMVNWACAACAPATQTKKASRSSRAASRPAPRPTSPCCVLLLIRARVKRRRSAHRARARQVVVLLLFLFVVTLLAAEPRLARAEEVEEVRELRGDGEVEAAARGVEAEAARLRRARPVVAAAEPQVGQHPEAQLGAERGARS